MKKFIATSFKNDDEYSEEFEAETAQDAIKLCEEKGWQLEGELIMSIPFDAMTFEEIDALCNSKNIGLH